MSLIKTETYYIICAAGARSAKVVEYLEDKGIHAVNVEGGMNEWEMKVLLSTVFKLILSKCFYHTSPTRASVFNTKRFLQYVMC